MAQPRRVLAVVIASAALAGCAGSGDRDASSPVDAGSTSTGAPRPSAPVAPSERLVVVGRPTDAQLELTRAQEHRILRERPERWRGRPVSVVPLDEVGPTQVVARVAGVDPVRDDADALEVTVVGDLMLTRGVPDAAAALAPMRRRCAART